MVQPPPPLKTIKTKTSTKKTKKGMDEKEQKQKHLFLPKRPLEKKIVMLKCFPTPFRNIVAKPCFMSQLPRCFSPKVLSRSLCLTAIVPGSVVTARTCETLKIGGNMCNKDTTNTWSMQNLCLRSTHRATGCNHGKGLVWDARALKFLIVMLVVTGTWVGVDPIYAN